MLFGMSEHAKSRSYPREESLIREFQKLHRVSGFKVIFIGLLLMRRIKAWDESNRDWSPALRSLSELLDIIVQLLMNE